MSLIIICIISLVTNQMLERRKLTDIDARCDRVDTNALEGLVEQGNVCGLLAGQFSSVCADIAGQLSLVAGCRTHEPLVRSPRHQLEITQGFPQGTTLQITALYGRGGTGRLRVPKLASLGTE